MNRTKEFYGYVDVDHQKGSKATKKVFYDTILDEIQNVERRPIQKLSYSNILKVEDDIQRIESSVNTLGIINLEGTEDEKIHFEGVKKILMMKINILKLKVEKYKSNKMGLALDLVPEKPKVFKEVQDVSYLEQKNLEIVESSMLEGYRITRQRLLEIESIQESINEHLQIQDERIDDVIGRTSEVHKSIGMSKDLVEKGTLNSKFMRRFLFVLFLCFTFLIIFLHLYYK